jgi:hypothetical protein
MNTREEIVQAMHDFQSGKFEQFAVQRGAPHNGEAP